MQDDSEITAYRLHPLLIYGVSVQLCLSEPNDMDVRVPHIPGTVRIFIPENVVVYLIRQDQPGPRQDQCGVGGNPQHAGDFPASFLIRSLCPHKNHLAFGASRVHGRLYSFPAILSRKAVGKNHSLFQLILTPFPALPVFYSDHTSDACPEAFESRRKGFSGFHSAVVRQTICPVFLRTLP